MTKTKKPTKGQRALLARMARVPLMVCKDASFNTQYMLADGTKVSQIIAANCIRKGWGVSQDDGLFAGMSQTYVPRPGL